MSTLRNSVKMTLMLADANTWKSSVAPRYSVKFSYWVWSLRHMMPYFVKKSGWRVGSSGLPTALRRRALESRMDLTGTSVIAAKSSFSSSSSSSAAAAAAEGASVLASPCGLSNGFT